MRTAQHLQSSTCYAHGDFMRMLAQLQHAHLDEQLTDVQAGLEHTQRADLRRISLENAAHGQQDDLIVDAAIACYVERRTGCLRLVDARVIYMRIRVRTQHWTAIAYGGAATSCAAVARGASNASAVAQRIQLRVNGALASKSNLSYFGYSCAAPTYLTLHSVVWRGSRCMLRHGNDGISRIEGLGTRTSGCRRRCLRYLGRLNVSVKSSIL